jgi:hypothetical protein
MPHLIESSAAKPQRSLTKLSLSQVSVTKATPTIFATFKFLTFQDGFQIFNFFHRFFKSKIKL